MRRVAVVSLVAAAASGCLGDFPEHLPDLVPPPPDPVAEGPHLLVLSQTSLRDHQSNLLVIVEGVNTANATVALATALVTAYDAHGSFIEARRALSPATYVRPQARAPFMVAFPDPDQAVHTYDVMAASPPASARGST